MNPHLRNALTSADPAHDSHRYPPEHQRQLVDRILAGETTPVALEPTTSTIPAVPAVPIARYRIPVSAAAAVLLATGAIVAVVHSRSPAPPAAAADVVTQRLDDIAQIAAVHESAPVGQDQYFYTRIVQAGAEMIAQPDGTYVAGPLPAPVTRDTWSAQDPTRKGLYIEGTTRTVINPQLGGPSGADLSYAQLAQLPTDPASLLRQVKAALPDGYSEDPDGGAFSVLMGYLEDAPPPAVAAALYRAAALIDGVHLTADAVDALGRHGTGLFHDSGEDQLRDEFIVDPATATYLGHDQYVVRDGTVGRLVSTEALLASGVAQRIGRRPAG